MPLSYLFERKVNMNGFFKMSNTIFSYDLSPKAFIVYAYFCNKKNRFGCVIAKCEDIAKACNLCRQSVMTAIVELEERELVTKHNRYNSLGYKSSSFSVTNLVSKKGWFKVERELFTTSIKPIDFMVYTFIKKCMFNSTSEAFPSINYISRNIFISHRRVETAVKYLRQFTFLNKIRRIRRNRTFKRNRYLHFKLRQIVRRHAISQRAPSRYSKGLLQNKKQKPYNLILQRFNTKCNSFSALGMVHSFNNSS